MSTNLQTVLEAALQLSSDDRACLADSLLETLESDVDHDVDEAWAVEIARRSREFDEGNVSTISWDEVRETVRKSDQSGAKPVIW